MPKFATVAVQRDVRHCSDVGNDPDRTTRDSGTPWPSTASKSNVIDGVTPYYGINRVDIVDVNEYNAICWVKLESVSCLEMNWISQADKKHF